MKLIWLAHRDILNPVSGGAEVLAFEVSRGLTRRGHQVALLSGQRGHLRSEEIIDHVSITRRSGWLGPHLAEPEFLSRHSDADVVIDDLGHAVPWATTLISRLPVIPLFYHLHRRTLPGQTSAGKAALLSGLESAYPILYHGRRFMTISPSSASDLSKLGIPPGDITIAPPGVDLEMFKPDGLTEKPELIYFGGLRPYKRASHGFEVLRMLRDRNLDVHLCVVGESDQLDRLRRQAEELRCAEWVEFAGRMSREQLARRVSRAWVNLHFSKSEGWCLSALEAAAAGVPTVGYQVPGISDSVRSGETGVLTPDSDLPAVANAVEGIIRSRPKWTDRCRGWAAGFSWDRCISIWEEQLLRAS